MKELMTVVVLTMPFLASGGWELPASRDAANLVDNVSFQRDPETSRLLEEETSRRVKEMAPTRKVALELLRKEQYAECLKVCKPMLTIDYAQGTFGPIAAESALRLGQFKYLANDPSLLRVPHDRKSADALVLLKTKGFDAASKVQLADGTIERFLRNGGVDGLLLPPDSSKKLEVLLYLRLGARTSLSSKESLFFYQRARDADKLNPVPFLFLAEERKDEQGHRVKGDMEKDLSKAWSLGLSSIKAYVRAYASKKGLNLYRISGGKEGKSSADQDLLTVLCVSDLQYGTCGWVGKGG